MIISAIDVGSNSVRLATFADGKTLYKRITTTRLGEGLALTGELSPAAMERTSAVIAEYIKTARQDGAQKIYAFATAAVRAAKNGKDFISLVKNSCGLTVEIISGETEAEIGLLGALGYADGGMIDLGGASTELTVRVGGRRIYAKSVDIGAVRLYDLCKRDKNALEKTINGKIEDFGGFTAENYNIYGVSGTATTLAALKHGLKEYDASVVQGTRLAVEEVENYAVNLLNTPVSDICKMLTVDERRADIIGGGALLLARLMQKLKVNAITVSDSDNLEGFVMLKEGGL